MMAAKSRGTGSERIMGKLKTSIELGNFYEAHQMYRTLYFRYISLKKYEELLCLLYDGAVLFLNHNQHNSGSDLAILFVEALNTAEKQVTDEYINKLGQLFAMMIADSPERMAFLAAALRWSSKQQDGVNYTTGHPRLHQSVAVTLWKEKNYPQSRYHFIHSTDGDGCATMLIEYHISKGYPSEVDLFIAQAVLQYLCLKNKSTASTAFYTYTEKHPSVQKGPPFFLPLLNFLQFLLLAIEREKLTFFTVICEQYQPSINRDPTYSEYMERIGQLFFGLSPPPKQATFGNLLQSLLGGFEDDDIKKEDSDSRPGTSRERHKTLEAEELD